MAPVKPKPSTAATTVSYCSDLRAPLTTVVGEVPRAAVHAREWAKVLAGDPVEINPTLGHGFKVMSVQEWAARWKRNDDFPVCLNCGGSNTKEHHFMQTWCRGKKTWEAESLCMDCLAFSWRSYTDPDFKTPEQYERERWVELMAAKPAVKAGGGAVPVAASAGRA